jgi:hypothetical protein
MQFSAYARAIPSACYGGGTRAVSTGDSGGSHSGSSSSSSARLRRRLAEPCFEARARRGRAARPVATRHARNPANMSTTPNPKAMQAGSSEKKVDIWAQVRLVPSLPSERKRAC